jgi:hypothetical protein
LACFESAFEREAMIIDWTGETIAWGVLGVSTLYLADRLVVWLVTRYRRPRERPEE